VSVDEPCAIVLDTTGCEDLFGGERGLLERVHHDLATLGFHAQVAIAPTPLCARAMARFKPFTTISHKDLPQALYPLGIEALELAPKAQQTLHELGIKRLLELFRLPRAQLLARFGMAVLDRIDALRGDKKDPRVFESEVRDWFIEEPLCDTIRDSAHLCDVIFDILKRLCDTLSKQGLGILKLETTLVHFDRRTSQIDTGMVQPSCDAEKIFRLLNLKLDNFDAGLGVESVLLRARQTKQLKPQEKTLAYENIATDTDLSALFDTLFNRIGDKNVFRFAPHESYIPERSIIKNSANDQRIGKVQDERPHCARPTRLLAEPEPIDVLAMLPDSPPRRILWRRNFVFHVMKADGPERIESEWWNNNTHETRDYYCVEDKNGLRLWVFKQSTGTQATPSWFIHGLLA
jgi:protein ImuB